MALVGHKFIARCSSSQTHLRTDALHLFNDDDDDDDYDGGNTENTNEDNINMEKSDTNNLLK